MQPQPASALLAALAAAEARGFRGQVAVRLEGEPPLVVVAGSADLEGRIPVTRATHFQVASITKYFTAVAVLRLVELGKMDLDAPIGRYVPGLPADHADLRLRELLSHRSGLANGYASEGIANRAEAIAALGALAADPAQRGEFHYTNDGYDLLAIAVELASGEPYERFVHRELLERAGVSPIRYWTETDVTDPRQVALCLQTMSPGLRVRNYGVLGSAAIVATADSLIDWQLAVWSGRVLSPTMRDELFFERLPVSIGSAGYGIFVAHDEDRGRRLLALGYEDWGANAVLSHWPEAGVVLAVVTSSGPAEQAGHPGWSRELTTTVSDLVFGTQPGTDVSGSPGITNRHEVAVSGQGDRLRGRTMPLLQKAVLINPMVYASEGFRGALTPQLPHLSLVAVFVALAVFDALLLRFGLVRFLGKAIG